MTFILFCFIEPRNPKNTNLNPYEIALHFLKFAKDLYMEKYLQLQYRLPYWSDTALTLLLVHIL